MKKDEIILQLAKKLHIGGRIWAKIYKTPDPHACTWDELSDYHRELYLAEAEFVIDYLNTINTNKR